MCLVPERAFSRAPVNLHLVHLCRFMVRAPNGLLRGFSWQRELSGLGAYAPASVLTDNGAVDFPAAPSLQRRIAIAIGRPAYPSASPHRDNVRPAGQEC